MAIEAELADGRILEFPDGTDPSVIQATVKKVLAVSPTFMEGLKGAAARGLEAVPESMAGVGLGIKSALGMASAGEQAAAIREEAKKPQVPGTSWESIEQAYEKEGLLSALKKAPSFVGEKILESAPSMAVPLAAGAAAGAMSGPFAPIVAPLAGIGTYGVQQFGQFMRRQAKEGATADTLDPGKAAVASAVSAPLGYFADRFTLGLSKVPTKVIGNEIAAELAKRTSGVAGRAVKGATLGIVAEAPTEVLEQAAERWQAGLSLTDEEAKREYKEAAAGAVAIGGVGGAASRVLQGAPKAEAPPEVAPVTPPEAYKPVPSLTGTDAATLLEEQAKGTAGTDLLAGAREREPNLYQPAPSVTGGDMASMLQGAPTAGADLVSASRERQAEQDRIQQEQKAQAEQQQASAQERTRQMPGMVGTDTTGTQLIQLQREKQKLEEAAAEKAKEIEYRKILATTYSADPLQNFRQQQAAIDRLDYTTPEVKAQEPAMTEQLLALQREDEKTAPEQKRSETFMIAPPTEGAPVTETVVTETKPDNTLTGQPTYTEGSVAEVPVQSLKLSTDIPQFKEGADQKGVTQEAKLEGKFDRRLASPIQVWQRANGDMEVISGRHRLDLAQRSGEKTIPAQIHKESDGFTADMARMLDIELNVKDGRGKVKDYVNFFKEFGLTKDQAKADGLLNTAIGRQAYTIADAGSPSLIAAHNNKDISDEAATSIAINAPKDEALQNLGMNQVIGGKSINHAVNFMRSAMAAGFKGQEGNGDLFGFDDSFAKEAEAVTKEATRQQREARQQLSAIKGAAKSPEKARLGGVDVKNLEATQAKIAELENTVNELENFHTNPELYKKLRQDAGLEQGLTAPTPESLKAADDRTKAEEKRIADEKKAADEKATADKDVGEFTLTGSDRAADADVNQGQMFEDQPPPELDTSDLKEVKGRHPQIQAAAKLLQDGKMTREGFEKYVDYYKPIAEVSSEKLLPPTSEQKMNETVNADKRDKINVPVEDGTKVGLRMDLPARERGGSVVSIHEGKSGKLTVGKLIGFRSTGWLKDVTFEVRSQEKGLAVAAGAGKAPQQTVEGTWFNLNPEETYAKVKELMKDPAWSQIGFDPSRHGYFYDRKTRQPVTSATEMYQVGQFLLAKNVKYAPKEQFLYSLRGKSEKQVTAFEQSLRTLLNKFGLKEIGLKLSEGMRDEGSYAAKLIQIASDSANPIRTLRHEAIHALRELGFFTDAQWKSLSKMAKDKWIDQYLKQRNIDGKPLKAGEESRYDAYMREYKGDMEKITEEAVADAFADFDTKPPAGMIQAIIQRLRNLFQSIRSALTKMESTEQIFGKVERGELKQEAERTTTESKSLRDRATANFLRWFGDSKVVDKNGEPLVVYHGTSKEFSAFRRRPAFFSPKESWAMFHASMDEDRNERKDRFPQVIDVYLSLQNPLVIDGKTLPNNAYLDNYEKQIKIAKRLKHDSLIITNSEGGTEYIAFKPEQIKSSTENNGEYSLTDADIRKSLRTTAGGEAAMETLKRMGREVKPPEDGYVKKTKQAWNNAVDNPQTTAQAVKDTLVRWGDQVQTWAFSSDAALNNNLKRAIMDSAKADPEKTAFLLNTSLSQTVHADALASLFITEGNIRYNKELLKWEAVKDKDNLVSLVKGLEDIAKKYNLTQEEAQLIGHTAFEAKRLKSLVAFNENLAQEVKDMRSEAAQLRKEGKSKAADSLYEKAAKRNKETKFIHMTDEQIADGNALFKNIPELDNLVKTWNGIRTNATKVLIDTGLWSEADADFLLSNADYVPFFREDQLENGKGPKEFISGLQVQAVDRKLKGSNKPVNDIFDNMVRWTQYSINRGVRNRSAVALAEGAAEMGMARKVPVRAGNENVVRVWKNGEEVLYSMADPMFIPAFTGLESIALPSWKILSKFSNILRQSVVMYPLFSISQVPQDAFAAMFTSGLKPQYALRIPVLAVKEFVKTLAGKSKTHEELKMFGVTGVRDFTADMARVDAEVLAGLKAEPGILNSIKSKLHHIAMASDNAVRQATYEAAMAQGMSQKEALEKSFEIWNIRRKGSSPTLAIAGQVIPFFNAYLAAQNVMVKVITGQGTSPTKKAEAYKTLAATTASVMTLSLLYTMMNGDDEDYLDKPAAQRDRLLMIPGSGGISIPLRKDLYTMPKIITEHTYLLMTDKGYEDGRKFRDSMKAALASTFFSPTAVPQALKPLIEVGINYDFFTGRPIIGQFQKKLEVERQFNDTTAELAKVFGSTGLVSPLNAEHLIRGMFGSVGGLVLYATNPILHSDLNVERPTLSAREMLATLPGTSGFISREDQTGLKNDFYVLRDEVAKVASTISDLKARSPEKLEEYLSSEDVIAKYGLSKAVNKMVEQLGKIRKQITQITNLPSDAMTSEEKQDQIKELKAIEKDMLKSINVKELRAAANL